jgi:hypothetical protein
MKLDELRRTKLEFISFKIGILEEKIQPFQQEYQRLKQEANVIVSQFCEENKLDIKKTDINLKTGEVSLIEDKKEV